jgi:hypothetical protein
MEIRAPVISPPQYQVKKQVKVQPGNWRPSVVAPG